MKQLFLIGFVALITVFAQAQKPIVIDLWPNGAPNETGLTGEEIYDEEKGFLSNISHPTLTVYPSYRDNGMAIIACPGGAYKGLSIGFEGHDMASWFNAQGITYAVLKYRMPNGNIEAPISDIQKAIRIMRERYGEWKINLRFLGVLGASAGGHLATTAATHFTKAEERPDFQILFYPAVRLNPGFAEIILGKNYSEEEFILYCNDQHVTPNTPPAFIMCSADDHICRKDCIRYFEVLLENQVQATLHVYPEGGHGWGFKDEFLYKRQWTGELEKWLHELNKQFLRSQQR